MAQSQRLLDGEQLMYARRGNYAHITHPGIYGRTILCPTEGDFIYGTGNQTEYDHAASLPLCPRCAKIADQRMRAPQ